MLLCIVAQFTFQALNQLFHRFSLTTSIMKLFDIQYNLLVGNVLRMRTSPDVSPDADADGDTTFVVST